MKSKLIKTLAIAALMSGMAGVAHATEGWYGRLDAGYSVDGQVKDVSVGGASAGDLDLDNDWMASGGVGYAYGNGFRSELELSYRQNDFSDIPGDAKAWAGMINGYYDFNRGGRFQPYLGVGIGAARVRAKVNGGPISLSDTDTVFAWQGLAGVGIELTPRLDLDVGYRYFRADGGKFNGAFDDGEVVRPFSIEGDYVHQAVTVGLRYQLHAPAAAPAPTPEPTPVAPTPAPTAEVCPQADFVVYFEWDRSNLNQAAMDTINSAAERAKACNVTAATVVGHTDTSGSTAYNQGLSERRASVVRDALVSAGMSAGTIQTEARGEADLAKQTRDGVREPLNRRTAVTITFH